MNIWKRYSMRVSKNWVKFNKMFTLSPCVEEVDKMTARLKLLKGAEVKHLDGPRWTGDGYYESTFLDPEGNRLELTV